MYEVVTELASTMKRTQRMLGGPGSENYRAMGDEIEWCKSAGLPDAGMLAWSAIRNAGIQYFTNGMELPGGGRGGGGGGCGSDRHLTSLRTPLTALPRPCSSSS